MKETRLSTLQAMPILGAIREDIVHFLIDKVDEIAIARGKFLFVENDPADAMYVLETGRVAILKQSQGIRYWLNTLSAGDCIGEMSLIDLGRRSGSVLALSDCTLLKLTYNALLELYQLDLEQFALIQMNIARELSRRLRVADERLLEELVKTGQSNAAGPAIR